jgi:hypothetical protein
MNDKTTSFPYAYILGEKKPGQKRRASVILLFSLFYFVIFTKTPSVVNVSGYRSRGPGSIF